MNFTYFGQRVDGVTFDLEGTIVNLEKHHHLAHAAVGRMLGLKLDIDNPKTFFDIPHMIGGPDRKIMEELVARAKVLKVLKIKEPVIDELLTEDRRIYHDLIGKAGPEQFQPREGFWEFFHQLRMFGVPIAIGTLTESSDAFLLLAKSGLSECFRSFNFFCASDVKHVKPDPEVYRATAGMLRISPYYQLVFEDSANGVLAAKSAGSIPIAVPVYNSPELIKRLTDAGAAQVFKNWTEFTISQGLYFEDRK